MIRESDKSSGSVTGLTSLLVWRLQQHAHAKVMGWGEGRDRERKGGEGMVLVDEIFDGLLMSLSFGFLHAQHGGTVNT